MGIVKVKQIRYAVKGKCVPKGTPGAERIVGWSKKYYARLRFKGKRQWFALSEDKATAKRMFLELQVNRQRIEVEPPPYSGTRSTTESSVHTCGSLGGGVACQRTGRRSRYGPATKVRWWCRW